MTVRGLRALLSGRIVQGVARFVAPRQKARWLQSIWIRRWLRVDLAVRGEVGFCSAICEVREGLWRLCWIGSLAAAHAQPLRLADQLRCFDLGSERRGLIGVEGLRLGASALVVAQDVRTRAVADRLLLQVAEQGVVLGHLGFSPRLVVLDVHVDSSGCVDHVLARGRLVEQGGVAAQRQLLLADHLPIFG